MSICGVCSNSINDGGEVKCAGVCGGVFHAACVKGDSDGVLTRSKNWKCKDCRQSSTSSKSAAVSTALTKDFMVRVLEDFKKDMFTEFNNLRSEMGGMTTSMQFLSDKMDAANALMNDMKKEQASIRKENAELQANNQFLSGLVSDLQERMRNIEQYSRKNNIEVSGIPNTPKEDIKSIVKDLGAALGVEVQPSHIAAAHRIPSYIKDRIPAIVIQFHDRDIKEALLTKFREARTKSHHLTADKINKVFPPSKVYVNDHLSPENKQFLSRLKKKCQDVGYTFVWCRDGKFFVRKAAGEKVQKVSTMADIDNLK